MVSDINEAGGHETVSEIVNATVAQYSKLEIACNNAGIGGESKQVGDC